MMVRNGQRKLNVTLSGMSEYCDAIYVLNDRSTDDTHVVCMQFPKVANVFTADPGISQQDWFFPESAMYNLLYRMADLYRPDWIIQLDDDEYITPAVRVREVLQAVPPNVSCVKFPKVSAWNDPEYPMLVPLMGKATNISAAAWRWYPGLKAGEQPLHNPRLPLNIHDHGEVMISRELQFVHQGWDTLEKRIGAVNKYFALDPEAHCNHGVPYDKGLLFGYSRDQVNLLIEEYRHRYAEMSGAYDFIPTASK